MVGTWEDKCHITHRETEARRDGDEGWNHNVLPVRTNHKHIPAPCRALLQTSRGCCPQAGLTQSSSISQHSGEGEGGGEAPCCAHPGCRKAVGACRYQHGWRVMEGFTGRAGHAVEMRWAEGEKRKSFLTSQPPKCRARGRGEGTSHQAVQETAKSWQASSWGRHQSYAPQRQRARGVRAVMDGVRGPEGAQLQAQMHEQGDTWPSPETWGQTLSLSFNLVLSAPPPPLQPHPAGGRPGEPCD